MADSLTVDSLRTALRRFEDFTAVHQGQGDTREALTVLREPLGITDEVIAEIVRWAEDFIEDEPHLVLLGFILGLYATNYGNL